ncbi:MAG TPA: NADH:flavin oxidoreductase/NADH oxidase [Anaeromyxobacter sp.]|nr:NADH:flavin oxidoreductase/NADH oxidase [Anaeromyxobacter sp.]
MSAPLLFTPWPMRSVTARNRVVIPPMCTYQAEDGVAHDGHLVHLGSFAQGGAGTIFVEATAVEPRGRITHGCLGLWNDAQAAALARVAAFLKERGAVAGVQLAHAGRKACVQRPWLGDGPLGLAPLGAGDEARGDRAWEIVGPTDEPAVAGWLVPRAMERADIDEVVRAFAAAARRALAAGFDAVEIHGAHGYLIHSFLSPLSNTRRDAYGDDRSGRMRLALEVTEAVRAVWPAEKPLFFRISAVDGLEGGWQLDDSVELARALAARGVDVVDCSSGGLHGSAVSALVPRALGYQVPYAARIRREAGVATEAVGLIVDGPQAEAILRAGDADLVAVGREALFDPYWAHHAARALDADPEFSAWPRLHGWYLARREKTLAKLGRGGGERSRTEAKP